MLNVLISRSLRLAYIIGIQNHYDYSVHVSSYSGVLYISAVAPVWMRSVELDTPP